MSETFNCRMAWRDSGGAVHTCKTQCESCVLPATASPDHGGDEMKKKIDPEIVLVWAIILAGLTAFWYKVITFMF